MTLATSSPNLSPIGQYHGIALALETRFPDPDMRIAFPFGPGGPGQPPLARTLQPRSRRLHMYAVHERIRKKKESQVSHDFQRRPSLRLRQSSNLLGTVHSAPFDRLARPHGRWPHDDIKSKYDLAYQPSRLSQASQRA